MKLRKQFIQRLLIAVLSLILAAGLSYTVKDLLSSRNPESALPIIRIDYNGVELPHEHWMMDAYSWDFLFTTREWSHENPDAWRYMEAAPVLPGAPIDIHFSFPAQTQIVSRAIAGNDDFEEIGGVLLTPQEPGEYTYKIEANWERRGWIRYYFKVRIA